MIGHCRLWNVLTVQTTRHGRSTLIAGDKGARLEPTYSRSGIAKTRSFILHLTIRRTRVNSCEKAAMKPDIFPVRVQYIMNDRREIIIALSKQLIDTREKESRYEKLTEWEHAESARCLRYICKSMDRLAISKTPADASFSKKSHFEVAISPITSNVCRISVFLEQTADAREQQ